MSKADAIAARGVPIVLAGGRKENLRFGFRALKALEDKFGSLVAVSEAIATEFHEDGRLKGKSYGLVWELVKAGLTHLEIDEVELDELADPSQFSEYFTAFSQAFSQALEGGAGPKEQAKKPKTSPSPGSGSTTSPPLSLAEPMSSSG